MTSQQKPPSYRFTNEWHAARNRLAAIEAWLDPGTIRHLLACGVAEGWHCLEVAAGGGSIAVWLSGQVGEKGYVLATDLDPRFLEHLDLPGLEVRRHDLITNTLPVEAFDLVHARLILAHLPDGNQTLRHLVATLKPGGFLVVEEMDFASVASADEDSAKGALFEKLVSAHHQVMTSHGFHLFYGRSLLNGLKAQGLIHVGTEGRATICSTGSAQARAWQLTLGQLREELLSSSALTSPELEQGLALLEAGSFTFLSQMTVSAWGQKPFSSSRAQKN